MGIMSFIQSSKDKFQEMKVNRLRDERNRLARRNLAMEKEANIKKEILETERDIQKKEKIDTDLKALREKRKQRFEKSKVKTKNLSKLGSINEGSKGLDFGGKGLEFGGKGFQL